MLDDFNLELLVEPLQNWFLEHKRVLPWREHPTGYYVWISEIMLQQTRVEAVKPYFDRFVKELPNIEALANCPEDKLLKLWEGLGYYNRVRNLKIAANQILEEYHGGMPTEYKELLKLRGIGSYTAGAISSIAFGKPVPAVDGNVLRVISRVTADDSDIMKQSVRKHMEERLLTLMCTNFIEEKNIQKAERNLSEQQKIMQIENNSAKQQKIICKESMEQEKDRNKNIVIPQIFNQALMELGAIVCVPNGAPHCEVCPWHDLCEARKQDRIGEIPVKKKTKERKIEEKTVFIIKDGEQIALHKRPKKGLLAGLYELPNVEGYLSEQEVTDYIRQQGYEPIRIQKVCDAKHIFSHVEWHMKGYVVFLQAKDYERTTNHSPLLMCRAVKEESLFCEPVQQKKEEWLFVDVEETKEHYAIPSAFVKYAEYLNLVLGKNALDQS